VCVCVCVYISGNIFAVHGRGRDARNFAMQIKLLKTCVFLL